MNDRDLTIVSSEQLSEILLRQQAYYRSGATRPIDFRKQQLGRLRDSLLRFEPELFAALKQDLNKSELESYSTELGIVLNEIGIAIRDVGRWAKPRRVRTPLTHFGASSRIIPEPLGTTVIIGPWNYPLQLIIMPLIGAIAAGNTAILKPSELAPATSQAIADLVRATFDPEYVAVVQGGADTSTELLKLPVDHIFFTGSPAVGKIVMEAAAKQLIPVTLELGGKSPCIVHKDANLVLAARRIIYGKATNAGQTCVAPDYLLVHRDVKSRLIELMSGEITSLYGSRPIDNPDYGAIVNERHFGRLLGYLEDGRIMIGGESDASTRKLAPTLLEGTPLDSRVMTEEIFGPILPVLEYESLEEAIAIIARNPKPLALYLFSDSSRVQRRIEDNVSFGGGCINDTIVHLATPYLPFGGVGTSGVGSYHGEYGFRTFSHYKSILKQTSRFDFPFRYPTSRWGLAVLRKLLR
jgi:aldehyde dehydrogenase (NAD+)